MPSFYYPEGYFGPICDSAVSDEDIAFRSRRAVDEEDLGDQRVLVYPSNGLEDPWWNEIKALTGEVYGFLVGIKCRQREDGTYFDCINLFADGKERDVDQVIQEAIGLKDNFFVPTINSDSCSPFDNDINIRPQPFFDVNGNRVLKYKRERSSPVTFAVDAGPKFGYSASSLSVAWNAAGTALVVTGTGTGSQDLTLEWDDDPNSAGVAVTSISITDDSGSTTTWTQSGESGEVTKTITITAGTYNLTFVGLNAANSPIQVNSNALCLKDGDGTDCNATFSIGDLSNVDFDYDEYQWNSDGRNYGAWVNPEICTLPGETQSVTYIISIEEDGTYAFSFGCDDSGSLILNDDDIIFNNINGGIFSTGSGSTPHTATRTLSRGTIKLTVSCTNSILASGSYNWDQNPGGWFIKLCKGSSCVSNTEIADWLYSGPAVPWSDFMNTYAVFPSNTDPLVGVSQSTTWNIDVPDTDDYTLEVQADSNATITLDGTSVATSTSYTSSTTATLSNLTVGSHTIGATVTNTALGGTNVDSWANNPAGVAWTITRPSSSTTENVSTTTSVPNNISAAFDSNGNIDITGDGSGRVQLIFEWDDNPNTNSTALGQIEIAGKTFTQTAGVETGNDSHIFDATTGQRFGIQIFNNSGGFSVTSNEICFRDLDGNDCNAKLTIASVINTGNTDKTTTESVTTTVTEEIIASSLDLSTTSGVDSNNLIWHTRKAVGYEYYTQ